MKQPEYKEGTEARDNFERGMKALFSIPKDAVVKVKKKSKASSSLRKPKRADKN